MPEHTRNHGVAIYMDSHATTPLDPRVLEAMLPFYRERFGNASSIDHPFGRQAREAVEHARAEVARLAGASKKEIIFTSGATESNNLALTGIARALADKGNHIITVATEHKAVLDTCRRLEREDFRVTCLGVDRDGFVDPDAIAASIGPVTILISVMAANNEIGVLQPLEAIGRIARERKVLFHTDAAQAFGKVPFDVEALGVDLASFSAHKMYGPQGVGALYVRTRRPTARLVPLLYGGGQERGWRPGTLNTAGIVGFGTAASICQAGMADEGRRLAGLRDRLLAGLRASIDGVRVNGSLDRRLPHNLNVSIAGTDETLASRLEGLAVSSGSACTTGSIAPSHVLRALGLSAAEAHGTLRFGLSRFTTADEVDEAVRIVARTVAEMRR